MANWVSFNFRSISIKCLKWEYCWCNKFNKLDQSKKYSSKFLMVVLSLPISLTLKFLARICGRQMNTRSICMEVYNVLELLMTILQSVVFVLEQTDRANKIFCPIKMKIISTQLVCCNSKKYVTNQPHQHIPQVLGHRCLTKGERWP